MIAAIDQMHLGTTAAFVVDGQVSTTLNVTTGIRQGGPLAPTLFVLAVDVLYDMVVAHPDLKGLALSDSATISIVGFTDDTSIYLRSPTEILILQDVLHTFGAASGLQVNVEKSTAIFLHPAGFDAHHATNGFPVADRGQLVRYLGGQISTEPAGHHVWDVTLQQLRTKLHLAAVKTTDVLQRVQVCQAVILPKILFVARHSWPTAEMVAKLQDFVNIYTWHGRLAKGDRVDRAWMDTNAATVGRQHGGLQVPNIRDELLLLSATTVQRWLSATDATAAAVGAVLAATPTSRDASHVAPGRGPAPHAKLALSIATTGRSVLQTATTFPWDDQEKAAVLSLLAQAGHAPLRDGEWVNGWYRRDYRVFKNTLKEIRSIQRSRAGRLNLQALFHTSVLGSDLLLHSSGRPLRSSDLPGLPTSCATVQDLLEIEWCNATTLRFRLKGAIYPYVATASFRLLCDTLVFCYPDILLQHDPANYLVEKGKAKDAWYLRNDTLGFCLMRLDAHNATHDLGAVSSLHHAETIARSATTRHSLAFAPHPVLSTVLRLWGTSRLHCKRALKALISKTNSYRIARDLERRRLLAHEASVEFGTALDLVSWRAIHRLRHSSSRQRLLFYKIKGLRLSGWDRLHERRGCPHCAALGTPGGTTFHIVWDCPAAASVWTQPRSVFAGLGLWKSADAATRTDFLTAVFSLRLPRVPPKVWELPILRKCPPTAGDTGDGPFPILQAVWQQLVLETLVVIYAWRNTMADTSRAWSERRAFANHTAYCQRVLDTLSLRLSRPELPEYAPRLVALFHDRLEDLTDFDPLQLSMADPVTRILFFDGRSSGNAGPGGAGAVIVDLSHDADPQILWSTANSLTDATTTNNQAVYHGLLLGLQAALDNGWGDITVVGDCALLLRQLQEYRIPVNAKLRALYFQARQLADRVGVRHWRQHVRAHNAMAISLANHAMNTRQSSQVHHPTRRPCHADLPELAASDLRPWLHSQVDPL